MPGIKPAGFRSRNRWSLVEVCVGLAVPGRPLRSLVAEDRSAAGFHDRTVPGTPMLTKLLPGPDATYPGRPPQLVSSTRAMWWSSGRSTRRSW
jgi:hypothetical protein